MPNHKRDKDPRFNIKYNHPIQYPLKKLNINVSTVGILKSSEIPLKDFMSKEEIPRTTMDNKIPELTAESDDKNSSQPIAYIVFDKDEREAVLKIEYPYNTISLLKIKAANGEELFGTGFFISPRCIITAGHCVYHKKSWVKSIEGFLAPRVISSPMETL